LRNATTGAASSIIPENLLLYLNLSLTLSRGEGSYINEML
jgi:hypothetical protein